MRDGVTIGVEPEHRQTSKLRSFPYAMSRSNVPRGSPMSTKAALVRLERTADELKKSRSIWWRVLAIVAGMFVMHSMGIRALQYQRESGAVIVASASERRIRAASGGRFNVSASDVKKGGGEVEAEGGRMERHSANSDGGSGSGEADSLVDSASDKTNGVRIEDDIRVREWKNREVPMFCRSLFENPLPFDKSCHRSGKNNTCVNLNGTVMFFSQYHQDFYLYTKHFKKLNRPGVYMDVASNDAIGISNSFFFDACMGWRGVCVEGNPEYYERIYRLRTCSLVPTCVARQDGTNVEFGLAGGAGGVLGDTHKHMKIWAERRKEVHTLKERCTTMEKIMGKEKYTVVDYLSLDVEGLELDVLKGVDWNRVKINVMTVEVSKLTITGIEEYLTGLGYRRHIPTLDEHSQRTGLLRDDAVFLHPDVVFGQPE